jgi:hypothetical protein
MSDSEEEPIVHVVDLADLLQTLSNMKDSIERDSRYHSGYQDACLDLIDHYSEALQDLVEQDNSTMH